MQKHLHQKFMHEVLSIAIEAGNEIMQVYQRLASLHIDAKMDGSPLTEADLLAHSLIVARLRHLTPQLPVLSEESNAFEIAERANWPTYWLIDPLDGTKEFINRNGQFTVNIALIEQSLPVLGVVYAPALNKAYFGGENLGAFAQIDGLEAYAIHCVTTLNNEPLRVVASKSHCDEQTIKFLQKLGEHQLTPTGSSLKLCLVAEGLADIYPRFGPTMEWDTAAAQAVVEGAGGVVCDFGGIPLSYNKTDLHNPPFFVAENSSKEKILELI